MTYVIFSNLIIKYTDVQKTSRWSHNVFEVTVSCLFPSSPINKIKSPHQENEKRKERENNVYVVLSNGRIWKRVSRRHDWVTTACFNHASSLKWKIKWQKIKRHKVGAAGTKKIRWQLKMSKTFQGGLSLEVKATTMEVQCTPLNWITDNWINRLL